MQSADTRTGTCTAPVPLQQQPQSQPQHGHSHNMVRTGDCQRQKKARPPHGADGVSLLLQGGRKREGGEVLHSHAIQWHPIVGCSADSIASRRASPWPFHSCCFCIITTLHAARAPTTQPPTCSAAVRIPPSVLQRRQRGRRGLFQCCGVPAASLWWCRSNL